MTICVVSLTNRPPFLGASDPLLGEGRRRILVKDIGVDRGLRKPKLEKMDATARPSVRKTTKSGCERNVGRSEGRKESDPAKFRRQQSFRDPSAARKNTETLCKLF